MYSKRCDRMWRFFVCLASSTMMVCLSVCGTGEGMEGSDILAIASQDDADSVAMIIDHTVLEPINVYDNTSWDSERIDGRFSGYAVVTGSYNEDHGRAYEQVSIQFHQYDDQSDYPSISGSAAMDGTLYCDSSIGYGNDYSGSWELSGQITLNPEAAEDEMYRYQGEVNFDLVYFTPFDYAGSITANGQTWDVDNAW